MLLLYYIDKTLYMCYTNRNRRNFKLFFDFDIHDRRQMSNNQTSRQTCKQTSTWKQKSTIIDGRDRNIVTFNLLSEKIKSYKTNLI